ncbi:MAG TPA: S8 family serine peptidase, partial [candidate division Zixibacteria bacterium]|nr:S8 family serine peptidase [candidate division Zixibacteria bacterium]
MHTINFHRYTNKFFLGLLMFALLTGMAGSSEIPVNVPGQMVCYVANPAIIDSINSEFGTEYITYNVLLHDYLLTTDTVRNLDSLASVITNYPGVAYCYPNRVLYAPEAVQASQPFVDAVGETIFPTQQAAQTLNLDSTHNYTTGGSATVGILDAGIDFGHELLWSNVSSGDDYVSGDNYSQEEPGGSAFGHGTFVAGIVRLTAPDAHIISYRVLDTAGIGNGFYIAEAIVEAVMDGCDAINLSFVMEGIHPTVEKALQYARSNDVVVVAAAGNDSSQVDRYPASSEYAMSVAAVDSFGFKAAFSNYSSTVK